MISSTPEFEALTVLRAVFDLADADVQPTVDLLGRLLGLSPRRISVLIAQLRRAGFVQLERLGLTMGGLVLATAMPGTEPRLPATPPEAARHAGCPSRAA